MTGWLADNWVVVIACCVGLVALVYILTRTASIAHYRTRSEYDRGDWLNKGNGEH